MVLYMNLRKKADAALSDVSDASRTVVNTTQWATVALVAVTALSLVGLMVGCVALRKVSNAD
jgi:hypothetical protein